MVLIPLLKHAWDRMFLSLPFNILTKQLINGFCLAIKLILKNSSDHISLISLFSSLNLPSAGNSADNCDSVVLNTYLSVSSIIISSPFLMQCSLCFVFLETEWLLNYPFIFFQICCTIWVLSIGCLFYLICQLFSLLPQIFRHVSIHDCVLRNTLGR